MKSVKLAFCLIAFLLSSVLTFAALDVKFTTAIGQSPDPAAAGNEVTFTVSFKPSGGAVSNFKIIGGVDGTQIFERTYASILADKIKTDSFKWTVTSGNHKVWFELDPSHTAGDSDYANNKVEKAISGTGFILNDKTKPNIDHLDKIGNLLRQRLNETDIYVEKIFLEREGGSPYVVAGELTWFNCEWKRMGNQPPGGFEVELYVDGVKQNCYLTTCLGKPETPTKIAKAKGLYTKGDHEFKCVVKWDDAGYNDDVPENDEMIKTINIPSADQY